ncbi:PREDICTED: protein FAM150A [Nipponia nippon]|uniref:protein FAM150A n=1 Tax=Nipponia nippon TaxID=128390 RepID=UPI000510A494|nr:PREDICTED: protein FAM150A [Nipponia nippon]
MWGRSWLPIASDDVAPVRYSPECALPEITREGRYYSNEYAGADYIREAHGPGGRIPPLRAQHRPPRSAPGGASAGTRAFRRRQRTALPSPLASSQTCLRLKVQEIQAVLGMGAWFTFWRMLRLGQRAVSPALAQVRPGRDKQGQFRAKHSCVVMFTDSAWPGDRAAGHLCRKIFPRDSSLKDKFIKHFTGPVTFSSECSKHFHRLYHNTRDCSTPAYYKRCARLLTRLAMSPLCTQS